MSRNLIVILVITLAAFSRLIPHEYNFTPLAALALFGGAFFSRPLMGFGVALLAMFLSDLAMEITGGTGFYPYQWTVYLAFIAISLIGRAMHGKVRMSMVLPAALVSSFVFFIISNTGAWLSIETYPKTFEGFMTALIAGLEFYRATLYSDLFFSFLLFGGWMFAESRKPAPVRQRS